MPKETAAFDAADHIRSPEDAALFLAAAFDEANDAKDPSIVTAALSAVAREGNMSALARDTELTRPALHKALNADGNPDFGTVFKVLDALWLRLTAVAT